MIDPSILTAYRGRRVLVTGGTGMIGREVVRLLADAGARVTSVSMDTLRVHETAEHLFGDLTDFAYCKDITRGMDAVCHVAGVKGSVEVTRSKPASFFVPLLMMNTNILEACRVNGVGQVVYTSTIGAYPSAEVLRESDELEDAPPMDGPPGWAKRMGELQIRAYRIQYGLERFSIVRPTNVYGPGDNFDPRNAMVVPSLMARIASGEDPLVVWGDGSAVRDFAYSEDVAEGVILALHHGTAGRPVNLGSGLETSVRDLVETLHAVVPFSFRFDASKPSGVPRRVMDISRARKLLGYDPRTSLAEGLKRTWDWFVGHRSESEAKQNYFRD